MTARAHPPPLRRLHPRPGPPRGVGPPRGARQDGATAVHRRSCSLPASSAGPAGGARGKPGPPASGRRGPGPTRGGRRHRAASAGGERPVGLACGASRAVRDRSAPPVGLGHQPGGGGAGLGRGRRGGRHVRRRRRSVRGTGRHAGARRRRAGAGQASRRPRPAGVAPRPLRHGDRPGRAWGPAGGHLATGDGLEALAQRRRRPRASRTSGSESPASHDALAAPCMAEAAGRPVAGGVRRGSLRGTLLEGYIDLSTGGPTAWSSWTTRRTAS